MHRKNTKNTEEWEHYIVFLSDTQRQDPIKTIQQICRWGTLHTTRTDILHLFRAVLSSKDWEDYTAADVLEEMFLFDRLIDLIEGACLLDDMIQEGMLTYTIQSKQQP